MRLFFRSISELSCRQVLNIMVILGFMLNYALRVNLTIAIVAMVEEPAHKLPILIASNEPTNKTLPHILHSAEGLSSAAHTLPISTTPEPFQNTTTDNVSTTHQTNERNEKKI